MGSSTRTSRLPALGLALVVALLAAVPVALAAEGEGEEVTRTAYVKRLEPICAANSKSNSKILKGVKQQVKKGKLVPAGRRFVRASAVFGRSVGQMEKVTQPSADEAKLKIWFGHLKGQQRYLLLVGKALKSGSKPKAQRYAVKLNKENKKAKNTVIAFGFKECKIDSSRYL